MSDMWTPHLVSCDISCVVWIPTHQGHTLLVLKVIDELFNPCPRSRLLRGGDLVIICVGETLWAGSVTHFTMETRWRCGMGCHGDSPEEQCYRRTIVSRDTVLRRPRLKASFFSSSPHRLFADPCTASDDVARME